MDIFQWGLLKQTRKQFVSWPKPPPPPLEYHLITFKIHNGYNNAYYGVAKTLPAVLEAYRDILARDDGYMDSSDEFSIWIDFLHVDFEDDNLIDIPLIQYEQSCYYGENDPPTIPPPVAEIVKRASRQFPNNSAVRRILGDGDYPFDLTFTTDFDDQDDEPEFVDESQALWHWCHGLRPCENIDLRQYLWQSEKREEEGEKYYVISLNKTQTTFRWFTFGAHDEWAICGQYQDLWDKF